MNYICSIHASSTLHPMVRSHSLPSNGRYVNVLWHTHTSDHCPYCVRVELALGWKNIPYKREVYGYGDTMGDEKKGLYFGGKSTIKRKVLPVLEIRGREPSPYMNESGTIVAFLEGLAGPSVNPQLLPSGESKCKRADLSDFLKSDGRFKVCQRVSWLVLSWSRWRILRIGQRLRMWNTQWISMKVRMVLQWCGEQESGSSGDGETSSISIVSYRTSTQVERIRTHGMMLCSFPSCVRCLVLLVSSGLNVSRRTWQVHWNAVVFLHIFLINLWFNNCTIKKKCFYMGPLDPRATWFRIAAEFLVFSAMTRSKSYIASTFADNFSYCIWNMLAVVVPSSLGDSPSLHRSMTGSKERVRGCISDIIYGWRYVVCSCDRLCVCIFVRW